MRKQRTRIDDEPRDDNKRTGEHDEQEGEEEERR